MFLNELPDFVSAETSSFTGLADTLVPVNLASVTADVPVTFPASPGVGATFGFKVTASHASGGTSSFSQRPFFCVEPANGTSINHTSYSAYAGDGGGLFSLWLPGEFLLFLYDGSTWQLIGHNLIKQTCYLLVSAADLEITTATQVAFDAEIKDNVNMHNTTSTQFAQIKRQGDYAFSCGAAWENSSTGQRFISVALGGTPVAQERKTGLFFSEGSAAGELSATPGQSAYMTVEQGSGGPLDLLADYTFMNVKEQ